MRVTKNSWISPFLSDPKLNFMGSIVAHSFPSGFVTYPFSRFYIILLTIKPTNTKANREA